jgi:hypothetical protein
MWPALLPARQLEGQNSRVNVWAIADLRPDSREATHWGETLQLRCLRKDFCATRQCSRSQDRAPTNQAVLV